VPRLWLQLLAAAIFLLAFKQSSALGPKTESGILPIDPPTPYIRFFSGEPPKGKVLVIHGLDASKEVMQFISKAFADGGFEVYAIDLPGHGDASAGFQIDLAEQTIRNARTHLGDIDIVLGHSLGAGLLLDLAETERFSTLVLLSPPPLPISEIHADHVLIATGAIDIPRIRSFAPVAADIAGHHVESWILPWGAHAAPILNPIYVNRIVDWAGGTGGSTRTAERMMWLAVMFVAAVGFGAAALPGRSREARVSPVRDTLIRYILASGAALAVLKFINPLHWLRLFATDYLIGFVFVAGLTLLAGWALHKKSQAGQSPPRPGRGVATAAGRFVQESQLLDQQHPGASRRSSSAEEGTSTHNLTLRANAYFVAAIASVFVIVVLGFVVSSQALHMSLSAGRWWRFPCIVLAGLPLFISDELMIRGTQSRAKSLVLGIATRALFLAFMLTGVLLLDRRNAFLVMIAPLIAVFWIGLWLATGVVHRHTRSPVAAALFAATVQGWGFAAWFVTI
jgi:pimeloyl-ACP methyl ester carboxylesterase